MKSARKTFMRTAICVLTAVFLVGLQQSSAQTCGYCKKNTDDKCNIPTIDNSCGCCPGSET